MIEQRPHEESAWGRGTRAFLRRKVAVVGLLILLGMLVIALFGTRLAPYNPDKPNYDVLLQPPSAGHWMGTDKFGRDILSRVLYGAHLTLGVSFLAVAVGLLIGLPLGLATGYFGGWFDTAVSRLFDIILAFPGLLLAVGIVALLGPGLTNALIAVAVFGIPNVARVVRGQVLALKNQDYVQAAGSLGSSDWRIIFRHLLPNALGPITVLVTLRLAQAVLTISGLSFLGLGVQPPTAEWGVMLSDGRELLSTAPWVASFPGLMIFLAVLGMNLVGDGLTDALDPRLTRQMQSR